MRNIAVAITSLSDRYDVAFRQSSFGNDGRIRRCRRGLLTGGVAPVLARRSGDVHEDG